MKVVILSDTHMPKRAKDLPDPLITHLQTCDLILHAGDWQTLALYETLKSYADVKGVFGNVDDDEVKLLFPEKQVIDIGVLKIGLTHGHLGKGRTTEARAISQFTSQKVDMIIFGHSHIPVKKEKDGCILFNPGSPTDKRRMKEYTFGILTIDDHEDIVLEHISFPNKVIPLK